MGAAAAGTQSRAGETNPRARRAWGRWVVFPGGRGSGPSPPRASIGPQGAEAAPRATAGRLTGRGRASVGGRGACWGAPARDGGVSGSRAGGRRRGVGLRAPGAGGTQVSPQVQGGPQGSQVAEGRGGVLGGSGGPQAPGPKTGGPVSPPPFLPRRQRARPPRNPPTPSPVCAFFQAPTATSSLPGRASRLFSNSSPKPPRPRTAPPSRL